MQAYPATYLLKKFNAPFGVRKFNALVEKAGIVTTKVKFSAKYQDANRPYKVIKDTYFGKNITTSDYPRRDRPQATLNKPPSSR